MWLKPQEERQMSKLKKTGAIVGAVLIGGLAGIGGADYFDDSEAQIADLENQVEEANHALIDLEEGTITQAEYDALVNEFEDFKDELADAIEEVEMEDSWKQIAEDYLFKKDYKLVDYLNDNLATRPDEIEDEDDLTITVLGDWDFDDVYYEEGEAEVYFDIKVEGFYNGDEDEDFREYLRVKVVIDDNDAERISFSEV